MSIKLALLIIVIMMITVIIIIAMVVKSYNNCNAINNIHRIYVFNFEHIMKLCIGTSVKYVIIYFLSFISLIYSVVML